MSIVREINLLTEKFTAYDISHFQETYDSSLSLDTVQIVDR